MSAVNENFCVGAYWTADGRRAVVDAICDGMLIGRINLSSSGGRPMWMPKTWSLNGECNFGRSPGDALCEQPKQKIKRTFWVNIYASGPGQLRKDWEEALLEASRCEEPCLCRVEVKVDAFVGEGLK